MLILDSFVDQREEIISEIVALLILPSVSLCYLCGFPMFSMLMAGLLRFVAARQR